jgi:thioredoxin 2
MSPNAPDIVLSCPSCSAKNRVLVDRLLDGPTCGSCSKALPPPHDPVELDDSNFEQVVSRSPVPVLVDFWAEWCGPCRMFAPTLKRFAEEAAGTVLVAKVNVDHARATAGRFRIQSIPTIALFRDGEVLDSRVGAQSLPALQQMLAGANAAR